MKVGRLGGSEGKEGGSVETGRLGGNEDRYAVLQFTFSHFNINVNCQITIIMDPAD